MKKKYLCSAILLIALNFCLMFIPIIKHPDWFPESLSCLYGMQNFPIDNSLLSIAEKLNYTPFKTFVISAQFEGILGILIVLATATSIVLLCLRKQFTFIYLIPSYLTILYCPTKAIFYAAIKSSKSYRYFFPSFAFYLAILLIIFGIVLELDKKYNFIPEINFPKITRKPSNKERISALEKELAELKAKDNQNNS